MANISNWLLTLVLTAVTDCSTEAIRVIPLLNSEHIMEDLAHKCTYTAHTQSIAIGICDAYRYGNVSMIYSDRVSCRDTVLHRYRNMEMVKQAE